MKIIKKELPEGIRKKFDTKIGKKVKIVNSLYSKNKKKKESEFGHTGHTREAAVAIDGLPLDFS